MSDADAYAEDLRRLRDMLCIAIASRPTPMNELAADVVRAVVERLLAAHEERQ